MIVCVCYNLNETKINEALSKGVSPNDIYDHYECDAPCECCMDMIEEMDKDIRENIVD